MLVAIVVITWGCSMRGWPGKSFASECEEMRRRVVIDEIGPQAT